MVLVESGHLESTDLRRMICTHQVHTRWQSSCTFSPISLPAPLPLPVSLIVNAHSSAVADPFWGVVHGVRPVDSKPKEKGEEIKRDMPKEGYPVN